MVLDPIPQPLPVHFFGSRPQPPTSRWKNRWKKRCHPRPVNLFDTIWQSTSPRMVPIRWPQQQIHNTSSCFAICVVLMVLCSNRAPQPAMMTIKMNECRLFTCARAAGVGEPLEGARDTASGDNFENEFGIEAYIYVYVYMYINIQIYACMYIYVYIYISMHIYIYSCIYICKYTYMHI